MNEPTDVTRSRMTRCPRCSSPDYFYDGLYIKCSACDYIQWARIIDDRLENVWELWQVKEGTNG